MGRIDGQVDGLGMEDTKRTLGHTIVRPGKGHPGKETTNTTMWQAQEAIKQGEKLYLISLRDKLATEQLSPEDTAQLQRKYDATFGTGSFQKYMAESSKFLSKSELHDQMLGHLLNPKKYH